MTIKHRRIRLTVQLILKKPIEHDSIGFWQSYSAYATIIIMQKVHKMHIKENTQQHNTDYFM